MLIKKSYQANKWAVMFSVGIFLSHSFLIRNSIKPLSLASANEIAIPNEWKMKMTQLVF